MREQAYSPDVPADAGLVILFTDHFEQYKQKDC